MREYKRKHRELSAGHRAKISRAMRGKKKSSLTKKLISQSMKRYWEGVEHMNNDVKPLNDDEQ